LVTLDTVDSPGSRDWPLSITNGTVALQRYQAGTLLPGINDRGHIVALSVASYANDDFSETQDFVRSYVGFPGPVISLFQVLGNRQFRLQFEARAGTGYSVLVSTNLTNWTLLGPATETTPGHFEFTDTDAPNHSQRFYQLRSP
jgi:hypothetical protein